MRVCVCFVCRIVVTIPRILLPADKTASGIPSLSDRQYVVSSSTTTKSEEDLTKSLFWYREELLGLVKTSWREVSFRLGRVLFLLDGFAKGCLGNFFQPGTSRRGILPLRSQRLTEPMLEVLRADEVSVSLSVKHQPVRPNEFFDVVVNVRNRLCKAGFPPFSFRETST